MTPRQLAHDLAMGWIKSMYRGHTGDLDDLTPARKRDTLAALAKIHDRLLEDSGLDGLPLTGSNP